MIARNHELVNGELVDVPGNTPLHNLIDSREAYLYSATRNVIY